MKRIAQMLVTLVAVAATAISAEVPQSHDMQSKGHDMDMSGCPMHKAHAAGVDRRGDEAMGFSHETTTHHFLLRKDGGIIDIAANDQNDAANVAAIRGHLSHIVKMFAAGDFDVPMFIHDQVPPGVPTMKQLKAEVRYQVEERPAGARIVITSANPKAIAAVHEFLKFQIEDHRTGDPLGER